MINIVWHDAYICNKSLKATKSVLQNEMAMIQKKTCKTTATTTNDDSQYMTKILIILPYQLTVVLIKFM